MEAQTNSAWLSACMAGHNGAAMDMAVKANGWPRQGCNGG